MNKQNNNTRLTRQGFTLIHMVMIIILMGVFAMLGSHLFATSTSMIRNTRDTQSILHIIDQSTAQLRCDVWRATRIESNNDEAKLHWPDGRIVKWQYKESGTLERSVVADGVTTQSNVYRFEDVPLSFSSHQTQLTLALSRSKNVQPFTAHFFSQWQLSVGRQP